MCLSMCASVLPSQTLSVCMCHLKLSLNRPRLSRTEPKYTHSLSAESSSDLFREAGNLRRFVNKTGLSLWTRFRPADMDICAAEAGEEGLEAVVSLRRRQNHGMRSSVRFIKGVELQQVSNNCTRIFLIYPCGWAWASLTVWVRLCNQRLARPFTFCPRALCLNFLCTVIVCCGVCPPGDSCMWCLWFPTELNYIYPD